MAAKSQDPVVEGMRLILELGGCDGAPPMELAAGAGTADLEALFLEELRNRRERLAHWMQLIREEVRREAALPRLRFNRRRQCRSRASSSMPHRQALR
jgi:hypothetical protein